VAALTDPADGIVGSALRPGHPDFLDLPWDLPLAQWEGRCPRLEQLPSGPSRHTVLFVSYAGVLYALKELPPDTATKEYSLLRRMADLRLPVVNPVGYVRTRHGEEETGVLITRYLDYSLPYHHLFMQPGLERYRRHLLDALAGLLVQVHLAGVYWGDCSLSNALFRRDAGTLQAYLVDAETSEVHPHLSSGLREHDLSIMEENVSGALLDLVAMQGLPTDYGVDEVAPEIRRRYQALWDEVTRTEVVAPAERYRIHERIRALNELGFSVEEIDLAAVEGGQRLRLRTFVADRSFHRDLLQGLTGIEAEELQARQMVNEIREVQATLAQQENRSFALSAAAYRWLTEIYQPATSRLQPLADRSTPPAELYCQLLEHKWYLSERARRDVGHQAALEDFAQLLARRKDERAGGSS
jgi:hypothetical protein